MGKIFVFGIDGAPPEYVFGEWLNELPNIKGIIEKGCYAKLNSTVPPLSGTAWASITTGKTPADTGIFEYVYRKNTSYDFSVISAMNIREKTIWRILSEKNKPSIVCFLPITWPIKPFDGNLISGFMTPPNADFTHPKELNTEISSVLKEPFVAVVPDFRNLSKEELIKEVYRTTEMHIKMMSYLLKNKPWEMFFGIIAGSDTMNHMFLRYLDKQHRKHEPNSKFENTLKDYYKFVDSKLGDLIKFLGDEVSIVILSDHGIGRMHTRINLTDWLIKEGYMALKKPVNEKCEFRLDMVDWKKTRAFAIGAYEGQIFLNLKGREPEGIVQPEDYDKLINELEAKIKEITGDRKEKLATKIFKKKEFFNDGKCSDIAPDMIIYFDDLQYGCNTTLIGNETLWSPNTAKGSDDAGHSRQGIFILKDGKTHGNLGEISYLDVTPTILNLLGVEIPGDMKGKIIGK